MANACYKRTSASFCESFTAFITASSARVPILSPPVVGVPALHSICNRVSSEHRRKFCIRLCKILNSLDVLRVKIEFTFSYIRLKQLFGSSLLKLYTRLSCHTLLNACKTSTNTAGKNCSTISVRSVVTVIRCNWPIVECFFFLNSSRKSGMTINGLGRFGSNFLNNFEITVGRYDVTSSAGLYGLFSTVICAALKLSAVCPSQKH